MKILVDTNILFSAMLWPGSKPAQVLAFVSEYHQLFIADWSIAELRDILTRKAPEVLPDVEVFLAEFPFELIIAPLHPEKLISDPKDQPILNAAIFADVDYIVSGDKHFLQLDMNHPKPITATDFLDQFDVEK